MSNSYTLTMFLVCRASVPRVNDALLQAGFGVIPFCAGPEGSRSTHIPGKISTAFSVRLTCDETLVEISPIMIALFTKAKIPFFGYVLECERTHAVRISTGHIPEALQAKSKLQFPVVPSVPVERAKGNVISLEDYKKKPN